MAQVIWLGAALAVLLMGSVAAGPVADPGPAGMSSPAAIGGPALTLEEALSRVRADNPGLQSVRREIDAARALREQAGLRPNPVLSFEQQRIPSGNRAWAAGLSIPLELGGRRPARIAAADSATRSAQADVAQRAADLRSQAIAAFFEVLLAQQRLELARASQDLARRATDVAGRRVQAGRVSPVEEARARVAESGVRIELNQAAADLQGARIRLSALWGMPAADAFVAETPADRLPSLPAEAGLPQRLQAAPALVRARAEVEHREALARLARSLAAPEAAVNLGSGTLIETGQRADQLGLSVSIPLFDRNQGNIREAQVRAEQSRQDLRAVEVGLRAELAQALTRLAAARREAEMARQDILPEATRTLEATTRGFELGKFSFLEVLDAQRTLFASRGQLLRALAESWQAAAEVERLLGPAGE